MSIVDILEFHDFSVPEGGLVLHMLLDLLQVTDYLLKLVCLASCLLPLLTLKGVTLGQVFQLA